MQEGKKEIHLLVVSGLLSILLWMTFYGHLRLQSRTNSTQVSERGKHTYMYSVHRVKHFTYNGACYTQ